MTTPERDPASCLWRLAAVRVVDRAVVRRQRADDDPADEAEDRTTDEEPIIEIAISSESPVRRRDWMTDEEYDEVLSHAAEDVDLSYARDGMPFLVDHDTKEQIGIVEDVRIDGDRKLRGRVRFSRSQRAQEVLDDIVRGIRRKISVGYETGRMYDEEEDAERGVKRRTYRGWRVLEASSVPIPADYEVGVGRAVRPGAAAPTTLPGLTQERTMAQVSGGTTAAGPDAAVRELVALATQFDRKADLARWIETGMTPDAVRSELMQQLDQQARAAATRPAAVVDLSARERRSYSMARAMQAALAGRREGLEFEVSEHIERKLGRAPTNALSFFVPSNLEARTLLSVTAATDKGAALEFDQYGGLIDLLRAKSRVIQLGAQTMSGLQGDLSFVDQAGAATWAWGAETATANYSSMTLQVRRMQPRPGAASTKYTRQLLAQSIESIENLIRNDFAAIAAIGIDAAAINGSGTNQPRGILNTTGVGAVPLGTAGAVPTYNTFVDLETEITQDNADIGAMAYLTTPAMVGLLKKTQQFSGTNGVPIFTGTAEDGLINGYKAVASTNVPSNLAKGTGTALHAIIFGAFNQCLIGEWGAGEVIVDPYAEAPNIVRVHYAAMVDVFLRHPESFAIVNDAKLS